MPRKKPRTPVVTRAAARKQHAVRTKPAPRPQFEQYLALMIVDGPNVNVLWRGRNSAYSRACPPFPFIELKKNLELVLKNRHPGKITKLHAALFFNIREGHKDYQNLFERPGWTVIRKDKVNPDDDIDEDIVSYVGNYRHYNKVSHVFLVGNDLANYLPIAENLNANGISVTFVCDDSGFSGRVRSSKLSGRSCIEINELVTRRRIPAKTPTPKQE